MLENIEQKLAQFQLQNSPISMREPIKYILIGNGKRLRPVLTLISTEAVGGKISDSISAAVAIEILHNFTLVHDDIMDNAPTRRGKITIHKKWDSNVAILAGDAMIALAYNELGKLNPKYFKNVIQLFTNGLFKVCEGQSLDKEFETKNVSIKEYFKMIDKKTSKLFSVAIEVGAVLGGGSKNEILALKKFGLYLGNAFQIQDDLLDVIADEKEFGKKIGGDIKEGKRTLLLIMAQQKSGGKDKILIDKVLNRKCKSEKEISEVISIYKKLNIIEDAKKNIIKNILQAKKELSKLKQNSAVKFLYWTLEQVSQRVY